MKKIVLSLAVLVLGCVACSTVNVPQVAVMDEIRRIDNIQSSHVPVSFLSQFTGIDKVANMIPGVNLSALNNVKSIDYMSVTNSGAKNKAHRLLESFYKGNTYEVLFQNKNGRYNNVGIYGLPAGDGKYKNVTLIKEDNAEITIVELKGSISAEDLKFIK